MHFDFGINPGLNDQTQIVHVYTHQCTSTQNEQSSTLNKQVPDISKSASVFSANLGFPNHPAWDIESVKTWMADLKSLSSQQCQFAGTKEYNTLHHLKSILLFHQGYTSQLENILFYCWDTSTVNWRLWAPMYRLMTKLYCICPSQDRPCIVSILFSMYSIWDFHKNWTACFEK